jgi:hypothetical protein
MKRKGEVERREVEERRVRYSRAQNLFCDPNLKTEKQRIPGYSSVANIACDVDFIDK